MNWFENLNPIIQALIATTFTWGVTALGSLVVCFFKEINKKVLNTILGFSAGVMIASSFWSLLAPAIDLSGELGYIAWILPAVGFTIAIIIMAGIRERNEFNDVPESFKGMPIVLLTAGLMAIAFFGFSGII